MHVNELYFLIENKILLSKRKTKMLFHWEFFFFSRDLFADVMSVHNRNMKHAHAIEFDQTNLLAML